MSRIILDPEQEIILDIIRHTLYNEPFIHNETANWDSVFFEMKQQGIGSFIQAVPKTAIHEKGTIHDCQGYVIWQLLKQKRILQEQSKIDRLMSDNGIEYVIIKGYAAAINYPKVEFRIMGDIDILTRPDQYELAISTFIENGYKLIHPRVENERHAELSGDQVIIEVHRQVSSFNEMDKANWMDKKLFSAIHRRMIYRIGDSSFPGLPVLENGMVLLHHMNQHLEDGIGLRQIIDWMMYVDKHLNDVLWNEEFKNCAQMMGLENLAKATTKMCTIYLGLDVEKCQWCVDANEKLCGKLLRDVFHNGNLGHKNNHVAGKVLLVSSHGHTPAEFFRRLQAIGLANWKLAQNNRLARCFAWGYQAIDYLKRTKSGSVRILQIVSNIAYGWKRNKMLSQLGVRRIKKGIARKNQRHRYSIYDADTTKR